VAPRVIALLEGTQGEAAVSRLQFSLYAALVSAYGFALGFLGDFREGQAQCEKALRMATEVNDIGSMGYVEYWYGSLLTMKGDSKNGIEHMHNAIKYCEQAQVVTLLGLAWNLLGQCYALLGDYETALKYMEKGLRIDSDLGVSYSMPVHYGSLSGIYLQLGDIDNTLSYFGKVLELAPKQESKFLEAEFCVGMGAGLGKLDKSQFAEAEEYIIRGMKTLEELKTRPECAHAYYALGELYADSGLNEKALEYLEKARDMYQEMGMEYYASKAQANLEMLEAR
jgi:tetratricopeptide (TPR) repeat protein